MFTFELLNAELILIKLLAYILVLENLTHAYDMVVNSFGPT